MSEISREKMLEWYDHIINRMPIGTDEYFMFQAIRSLIEKVGEWQRKIREIEKIAYVEEQDDTGILREIRDFWKERP